MYFWIWEGFICIFENCWRLGKYMFRLWDVCNENNNFLFLGFCCCFCVKFFFLIFFDYRIFFYFVNIWSNVESMDYFNF